MADHRLRPARATDLPGRLVGARAARGGVVVLLGMGACAGPPEGDAPPCARLLPGDLVITEIMADPDGVDTGKEYIEIYNAAPFEADLDGLVLAHSGGDGSGERRTVLRGLRLPARGYLALGDARSTPPPSHLGHAYGDRLGALRNGGGRLSLRCAGELLVEQSYGAARPGRALELDGRATPEVSLARERERWCSATTPLPSLEPAGKNHGTPGLPNAPCASPAPAGGCVDPASGQLRPPRFPLPGDLRITEFMAHPRGVPDADGEWIELLALADLDLNEVQVAIDGGASTTVRAPGCLPIPRGERLLLARRAEPERNGGLPAVHATFGFALANTGRRAIVLRAPPVGSGASNAGLLVEIDRVEYDGAVRGRSLQLFPEPGPYADGAPGAVEPPRWCAAPESARYGAGDAGTPGLPNPRCDDPPGRDPTTEGVAAVPTETPAAAAAVATCIDPATGGPRAPVAPAPGDLLLTEIMRAPGTGNGGAGEWFELYAVRDVDLNDVELRNEGSGRTRLHSSACLRARAGDWLLLARSADPGRNGGLPEPFATFSFALADGATSTVTERALVVLHQGVELDRARWTRSTRGVSEQRSWVEDAAIENAAVAGAAEPRWCASSAARALPSGDRGTPGAHNEVCPP